MLELLGHCRRVFQTPIIPSPLISQANQEGFPAPWSRNGQGSSPEIPIGEASNYFYYSP